MKQNRRFLMLGSLFMTVLASIPIIIFLLRDPYAFNTWASLGAGLALSLPLYLYIALSRRRFLRGEPTLQPPPTTNSPYRWLIPSVIGGLLLARFAIFVLNESLAENLYICLSSWLLSTFAFFAFLGWRYA